MKKYKKFSLLLVVLLIASLFAGCSKDEKDFMDAFIKSQEILTLESTSNMEFDLSVEGLDEDSQVVFDEFANQINDLKLTIDQKAVSNQEQTVARAQIDANIQLPDMSFDSSIWVDVDMSSDQLASTQVYKLPSMLMNLIPGAAGKEYIVLDLDSMNQSILEMEEDMPNQASLDETMAIAMEYQEKFVDAFVGYMKNYDFDSSVVSKLDDKTVDGEKIKYYQVEFDNDSFKDFLKYTTISMLEDENILPLFENYMAEIMKLSGEDMPEEFSITGNIGEMVKKTREFFKAIEDLTILGEDGILITYGINEDGYFVSEEGSMNFLIDTEEFMNIFAATMQGENSLMEEDEFLQEMPRPIFELSISYDTKITSINEDLEITMPLTTKENSIDYMELLESMIPDMEEDMGLMVIVEDEIVEFVNQPILVDGSYLVSSRDMADAFDANISWNANTKEITIAKDDKQLVFNSNNKQLLVNGQAQDLNTSIALIDGVSYIPLRAVSENLGYTVDWNGEFQMVLIYK